MFRDGMNPDGPRCDVGHMTIRRGEGTPLGAAQSRRDYFFVLEGVGVGVAEEDSPEGPSET